MVRTLTGLFWPYQISILEKDLLNQRAKALSGGRTSESMFQEWLRDAESKAAVYLGHISIMIAVAGVFAATANEKGPLLQLSFGGELIAYLLLALLCLRCQMNLGQFVFSKVRERKEIRKSPFSYLGLTDDRPPEEVTVGRGQVFNEIIQGEVILRERLVLIVMIGLWLLTLGLVVLVSLSMDLAGAFNSIVAGSDPASIADPLIEENSMQRLPKLPKSW